MKKKALLFSCILMILLSITAASAAGQAASRAPITKVDLGLSTLELEVGESYTFDVTFEPENTAFRSLSWFTTDDSIVSIDSRTDTITALRPGTVRVYAESFDYSSGAYCDVVVTGGVGKDASELVSGADFVGLSTGDLAKIKSNSFNNFLSFVLSAEFSPESLEKISERYFMIMAKVEAGTESEESAKMRTLGMTHPYELKSLHMVTLEGTFAQIISYVRDNPSLEYVFGGEVKFLDDPVSEEISVNDGSKALNLRDHVEDITQVSIAHNLGYTGQGTTIAVIDTGLNSAHVQFGNRVIDEFCFSVYTPQEQKINGNGWYAVCKDSDLSADGEEPYIAYSAEPANARKKINFNHGSHVTGIAAGRDGIAPDANIVAVQIFSERVWDCLDDEAKTYSCSDEYGAGKCCTNNYSTNAEIIAYDYLLGLRNDKGITVDAINMSYGINKLEDGSPITGMCDDSANYYYELGDGTRFTQLSLFTDLLKQGTIPVAASGNDCNGKACTWEEAFKYDSMINNPACLSKVFSVGSVSLASDTGEILITPYSNHSPVVDILAPGSRLYSAAYVYDPNPDAESTCEGSNCYQLMTGTSMATPVVTGSLALLKSAIPGKTPAEYESIMLEMSQNKTSNWRGYVTFKGHAEQKTQKFLYNKPVLNFVNIKSIVDKYNPQGPVLPAEITLIPSGSATIEVGKTLQLQAVVLPANASDRTVSWSSADPAIASVSSNGLVSGVSVGTTTITAAANGNPDVTAQTRITVIDAQPGPGPQPGPHFFRLGGDCLPQTGFSAHRPQALSSMPLNVTYKPLTWSLEIPSLSVSANLVEVPFVDGEYPIEWLGSSVGLLEGSADPGKGSLVLTGHNHLNTMEAGPFAYLLSMKTNDRIFLHDGNDNVKTYVVYANEKVSRTDFDAVEQIAAMFDDTITLITCEDEMVDGAYANRRVVAARPMTE